MQKKRYVFPATLSLLIAIGLLMVYWTWGAVAPQTASQHLKSGKEFFNQKQYPEATVELLNALQVDEKERDARFLLARSYIAQGDSVSGVKEFRRLLEYYPDDQEANIHLGNIYLTRGRQDPTFFKESKMIAEKIIAANEKSIPAMILLGNALAGLQDYESSIGQFEEALRLDPKNSGTLVSIGATEAMRKNYAEAEKAFLKARQADPENKAALVSLGSFYISTNKLSDAETVFKAALSQFPSDRQIQLAAVAFYYQSHRFEEVEKILKDAQSKSPDDPSPSLMLAGYNRARNREADAQVLLRELKKKFPQEIRVSLDLASSLVQDDPAASRKEVEAILKAYPPNVPARVILGELQFRAKQYDEAVATLNVPTLLSSRFPRVHLLLGLIDAGRGQTDKALDHYKSSLDVDPTYLPSRLSLAGLLLKVGRTADARVEVKKVLEVQPHNAEARLIKADADSMENKSADAERELTALQKEQPDNATVHLRTGLFYESRGKAPQAEKSFLRALQLTPDSAEVLQNVVQFYVFQRATDRAIKIIQDTVPDASKKAFHYELMGKVYSKGGRSQEAEAAFKKSLSMEPDRQDSKTALTTEYIQMKRYDDAIKQLDDLLKQTPEDASAHVMRGLVFQKKDNLDLAKENYQAALKVNPDSYVAANNLAYLLADEGRDLEVALTWAQTARRLKPNDPISADTLGWVQHKMGREVLARDQLQFAVSKQPDNPTFQYHLGLIYKELKQIPQAQAAFRKALNSKSDFREKGLAEAALKDLS